MTSRCDAVPSCYVVVADRGGAPGSGGQGWLRRLRCSLLLPSCGLGRGEWRVEAVEVRHGDGRTVTSSWAIGGVISSGGLEQLWQRLSFLLPPSSFSFPLESAWYALGRRPSSGGGWMEGL